MMKTELAYLAVLPARLTGHTGQEGRKAALSDSAENARGTMKTPIHVSWGIGSLFLETV
jgi:hypothetical protein